jgi:hypothetical protein
MPTFERLAVVPWEMKSFDAAQGVFVGIASTPQVDRMGEVVSSDAMREAAERYLRNPVITDSHGRAIGKGLRVEVTDAGTLLEGYVTDKTEQGRDVRGLLEDGIFRSLSIGFNPYSRSYGPHPDGTADYELVSPSEKPSSTTGYGFGPWFSENQDTLVWKRIDWMETAVCAIPCNPGASIQLAKSMGLDMPDLRDDSDLEQTRFLANVERVRTAALSISNIRKHWQKEGADLCPEQLAALMGAFEQLADLLEIHPQQRNLFAALAVAKAGRVLSQANRTAVDNAVAALQEVIAKDDASRSTPADGDADGDDGKSAGPCVLLLPEKPRLTLPQRPRLSLPA